MRYTLTLLSLLLLSPGVWGQQPAAAAANDEFPALQFLPAGSVVEGISIPRYENHRVTALLMAESMQVQDRSTVIMRALEASLYGEDGNQTDIETASVTYSFATKTAKSTGKAQVKDPRFSAKGKEVTFSTAIRKGFLRGPVTTTVSASQFSSSKGDKK